MNVGEVAIERGMLEATRWINRDGETAPCRLKRFAADHFDGKANECSI